MIYNVCFFTHLFFSVCSEVFFDTKHLVHLVSKKDMLSLYMNTKIYHTIVDAICLIINHDMSKFSKAEKLPHYVFTTDHSVSHVVIHFSYI